jgi:hypothetical protein
MYFKLFRLTHAIFASAYLVVPFSRERGSEIVLFADNGQGEV